MAVQKNKKLVTVRKTVSPQLRKTLTDGKVVTITTTDNAEESFIRVDRGIKGPKLAEHIINMMMALSLPERNEVTELVLRQLVLSSINEVSEKRESYQHADKATEILHQMIGGTLFNGATTEAQKIVSSHR